MKTQIYLVRHCESEGNACRRNHAQFDGIVTRKGLVQSEALAKRFADIHIDAIYSSDAYRARMTAEPLAAQKHLKVKLRRLLREYTIGCWEGGAIGTTALKYPDLWKVWITTPYAHTIPGADNFVTVSERGVWIIKQMAEENPGGTVVAITHTCTLMCTLTKLYGKPISYYNEIKGGDNTAVTLVEVDEEGNIEVIYVNDITHLPPELRRSNYTGRSAETNFAFDITKDGPYWTIIPRLIDVPHGVVHVQRQTPFGEDTGEVLDLTVDEDLCYKGYAEQALGEAIEELRMDGVRYLLMKDNGVPVFNYLFDRFCFETYEKDPAYKAMRITVPGVEGPIY